MSRTKELGALWAAVGLAIGLSVFLSDTSAFTPAVAEESPPANAEAPKPAATRPPAFVSAAELIEIGRPERLALRSGVALILDEYDGIPLYERNVDQPRPIASLTKLMTAMVLLDARLPMDEPIEITRDDRDRLRGSGSRLRFGTVLTRRDALHAALAASDNRAAAALARTYPGGTGAMIDAMNAKARALGMAHSRFADSSGLHSGNVSTAADLARLATAVERYPLIAELSTTPTFQLTDLRTGRPVGFVNTNRLVRSDRWDIALSKTGYTSDAGNCLVMRAQIADRPLTIVLLNSWGKLSKYGDSSRIRDWLLKTQQAAAKHRRTLASAS
ncbi:peptidase S11 [Sulfurifustis variabilis]|uniref:Peptidase S11 n=1 Tax=Sulfurifustis variabilis TaxID=1675686 RepID=A0A1B4V261_9GAMM|nr:serine hydrolase [Sulfurifustis variabilis]BAU47590.1 peptidase S11 [Sulfurifustis variabilis]